MIRRAMRSGVAVFALAMLVVAIAASPSVASKDSDAAVKAQKRSFEYLSNGQYDLAYGLLHPAQRALITRSEFIDCYTRTQAGVTAKITRVNKTSRTTAQVPGTDVQARSYAIDADVQVSRGGSEPQEVTATLNVFKVRGKWKIVLNAGVLQQCTSSGT
jgi:hypothetical protein